MYDKAIPVVVVIHMPSASFFCKPQQHLRSADLLADSMGKGKRKQLSCQSPPLSCHLSFLIAETSLSLGFYLMSKQKNSNQSESPLSSESNA